jgi:hypothetical protein
MLDIPPWEATGLPGGIRTEDLSIASRYLGRNCIWQSSRLLPADTDTNGWYFRLYGLYYQHNIERLRKLLEYSPIKDGVYRGQAEKYYPALLLPDPSPLEPGVTVRPIAVCSHSGYIGSVWHEEVTRLRSIVDEAYVSGRYIFTRLRLEEKSDDIYPTGWKPVVWLPTDPPRW